MITSNEAKIDLWRLCGAECGNSHLMRPRCLWGIWGTSPRLLRAYLRKLSLWLESFHFCMSLPVFFDVYFPIAEQFSPTFHLSNRMMLIVVNFQPLWKLSSRYKVISPFGNCLPGAEILQSPFSIQVGVSHEITFAA